MNSLKGQREVIDALFGHGGTASIKEIAATTGKRPSEVKRFLQQLGGRVGETHSGNGRWRLLERH